MSVEIENYSQLNGAIGSNGNANDQAGDQATSSGLSNNVKNEDVAPVAAAAAADTYDTAFPSLPAAPASQPVGSAWGADTENKLSIKRHLNHSQVIRVPLEERKDMATFGNETNKKCEDIAARLGVKVEICCSKDQTLHIVITGLEDKVNEAKRAIVVELQTERDHKMNVPKEQHKFLIGKAGAILKELQEKTCTKIQVPRSDSNSDLVTITGPKEGIELAIHEIQLIVDEQSKTGLERLNISKLYHPWIRGANNEVANEIAQRTGAKINIPPPLVEKDEIVVSGDREKVDAAVNEIKKIYAAKSKLNITKLAIQIAKSQHKLIIGKSGSTVQDIFKDYDVYVQVPKLDSPLETILLYGEESKLGAALSQVIAKSNSVISIKIDVPSWLHRHMIGEKGANIAKITADFPNTHVKFENDDKITLDGPPDEVEKVRERLENITLGLKQVMASEELTVDPKFYPQLIGSKDRKTENHIAKLNKEHGVVIRLPTAESAKSNVVRIEGPHDAVRKAKQELNELVPRLENERSKDIIIDQKYHSTLIGKSGKSLNEIRAKFNDIQINIPSVQEKSDVITIRGNKNDVEKCHKHLQQVYKDLQENNYHEEIQIVKEFHRIIIGKQGALIKKIRDETHTRIDIPSEESDSNAIVLTGKQENVLKARRLIEDKIKELVNIKEDHVEIPHQFHRDLIGKNGHIIKEIRNECGGVIISFPPETKPTENRITLKGSADDIAKAKKELLKLYEERNDMSYSEEINAKLEYHKFLVGRKGTNVNTLREKYKVRIVFPNNNASEAAAKAEGSAGAENAKTDVITIYGKKENVKLARTELEETIKQLEDQVTDEIQVDSKWHKNFTAKSAKLINEISDENCKVKISFPKAANTHAVQLKGPRDAVEAAKKRIAEHIHRLENQISEQVIIPQQYHATVIGKKGENTQKICDEFKVAILFQAKSSNEQAENGQQQQANNNNNEAATATNNDEASHEDASSSTPHSPSKADIVYINGYKDDVEKAKEALLALVPIKEDVPFPAKFHKELLADKAKLLKDMKDKHKVQVNVPRKGDDLDYVTLVGLQESLPDAKQELAELLDTFEAKNYTVELTNLRADLIPQLRGRNGTEVEKLEKKFQVKIQFSKKGEPDRILIRGLKEDVERCEALIKKKIEDEESKLSQEVEIDNRVHSRIIGQQGKALAKITEKYKVEVKFQGRSSDTVIVKGTSNEAIEDAIDHLKNLEEEYLQDVIDRELYTRPTNKSGGDQQSNANGQSKGFVVRGGPWEQYAPGESVPDTNNMEDFPTISSAGGEGAGGGANGQRAAIWGPSRK